MYVLCNPGIYTVLAHSICSLNVDFLILSELWEINYFILDTVFPPMNF